MNDIAMQDAHGVLTEPMTLTIQRLLTGTPERVWAYLTESDLRRRWLASGEMELRVGAAGYSRDNPMERHVRDARMFAIAGGTAQVLRTQVAEQILGRKLPQTRDGFARMAEEQDQARRSAAD